LTVRVIHKILCYLPLPFTTAVRFLYTAFKETKRISRVRTLMSSSLRASAQEILNGFLWNCAFCTPMDATSLSCPLNFLPSILTIWRKPTEWGGNDRRCQYLSSIAVITRGIINSTGYCGNNTNHSSQSGGHQRSRELIQNNKVQTRHIFNYAQWYS